MQSCTRARRWLSTATLVAFVLPAVSLAQPGFPPDDPDSWRVAGTAKVLCSALFVSGRDEQEARTNVSPYFLGAKLDSITGFQVDRQHKLVRLTLANRITREAKHYGDQGCIIHQPGKDTVYFRPVRVTTTLPDAATMPWPMGDVLPTTPLPAEIDTVKLRQAVDAAFANPAGLTAAFVVVHKGRIVAERYANGAHKDMQLESWSMGKSITGTLIGLLIRDGAFKLEDPAPVAEWRKTPNDPRAKIRVMDLMRMSSGLRFSRGSPEDRPGYHDHDLIYTGAIDAFNFSVTRELQFDPNTFGRYRNSDPMTLGLLIRDAVRARGEEYLTWPQRALFDKIGIRRQVLETDPYGNFLLSGYDYGTARNWARIGLLYLNDGVWMGQRLLPEGFVQFVSTPAPAWADSGYGGMVWVNARGQFRNLPRDAYAFRGAGGQDTYVIPSRDLVIVRMGHFPGSRVGGQDLQRAHALLMEAIPARPPSDASDLEGTFSIIGRDPATGELGIAVHSRTIAVGARVRGGKGGVAVFAHQSGSNPMYSDVGIELLEAGMAPQQALDFLLRADEGRNSRQVSILDIQGRTAAWTSPTITDWKGHRCGTNYCAQGNTLTGPAVVEQMARSFEASTGPLAERLLDALDAGQQAGGDKRGVQSAGLMILKPLTIAGYGDRALDLRVDEHKDPFGELRRILRAVRSGDVRAEVNRLLNANDTTAALAKAVAAREMSPEIDANWITLAQVYLRLGRKPEALAAVRRAVELNPANRTQLPTNRAFASLTGDPEFVRIVSPP